MQKKLTDCAHVIIPNRPAKHAWKIQILWRYKDARTMNVVAVAAVTSNKASRSIEIENSNLNRD